MTYEVRVRALNVAIVAAVGFAVSLITSTTVAARAYTQHGRAALASDESITVKGSVRRRITSDQAVWQISVQGRAATLADAFGRVDGAVARVQKFLTDAGFQGGEIGLGAIDTSTYYANDEHGNQTRQIAEYLLTRRFCIATSDVLRVLRSAGRVTELINEGIEVISFAPAYYYTKLADLKVDLMAEASADARARAEKIAAHTGARLGTLRDARMGVLQITAPFSTETADYGIYDTGTIEKDVTAVVTATFRLSDD